MNAKELKKFMTYYRDMGFIELYKILPNITDYDKFIFDNNKFMFLDNADFVDFEKIIKHYNDDFSVSLEQ